MRQLASRYRRLDGALGDLPLEEPMLLTELDGFLTGIVLCPVPVARGEWMQSVWGADGNGVAPFEDPLDVQWFADAVQARHDEIVRDLARDRPQPLFDVDERTGELLWELWIDGLAEAMALRRDAWASVAEGEDAEAADAMAQLSALIAVADDESPLDSMEINALDAEAPAILIDAVRRLHAARVRAGGGAAVAAPVAVAKVGRNDPCACGSGRKSKRCCG